MERRGESEHPRCNDPERVLQIRQRVDQLFQDSDIETVRILSQFLMEMRREYLDGEE